MRENDVSSFKGIFWWSSHISIVLFPGYRAVSFGFPPWPPYSFPVDGSAAPTWATGAVRRGEAGGGG